MPYVKQEIRAEFDKPIDKIINRLWCLDDVARDGAANYVISRIIAGSFSNEPCKGNSPGWSYRNASRAYGTFLAAAAEFYRRVLVPVEDGAINRNGDIAGYELEQRYVISPDYQRYLDYSKGLNAQSMLSPLTFAEFLIRFPKGTT